MGEKSFIKNLSIKWKILTGAFVVFFFTASCRKAPALIAWGYKAISFFLH